MLGGGFVSFLFSGNPRTLMSGVLYGGALLALSTLSLKVWRQGKPSFPFILGQAGDCILLLEILTMISFYFSMHPVKWDSMFSSLSQMLHNCVNLHNSCVNLAKIYHLVEQVVSQNL